MTPRTQSTIYKRFLKDLQHLSIDSLQTIIDESQEIIDRAQARQSAARDCLIEAKIQKSVSERVTTQIVNIETSKNIKQTLKDRA